MLFYVLSLGSCSLFVVVLLSEQLSILGQVELRQISILWYYFVFFTEEQ